MIGSRRVLGLIPARGGSKGVPRKNVADAAGRPLLAWTIDAARASRFLDDIVLSTDDEEIAGVGRSLGCAVPFVRPAELASDTAGAVDVALHAVEAIRGFDVVVLLQPTSPLRTTQDIDATCSLLNDESVPAAVSVTVALEHPAWMYQLGVASDLAPVLNLPQPPKRRQDLQPVYVLNGAVYAIGVGELRSARTFVPVGCKAHVMPRERSLDIDTADDLEEFNRLLVRR